MATTKDFQKFSPRGYLAEHYNVKAPETDFILRFLHYAYRDYGKKNLSILELGGGATVYQLISASGYAERIIFTDFLQKNLDEVQRWLRKERGAFDWRPYFGRVAALEGKRPEELEKRLRSRLAHVQTFSLLDPDKSLAGRTFDVVSSHFCAESITDRRVEFVKALHTVTSRVRPGGFLVMSLLKNFTSYRDGARSFPAYPVDEKAMRRYLTRLGFEAIEIQTVDVEDDGKTYANICLHARKKK